MMLRTTSIPGWDVMDRNAGPKIRYRRNVFENRIGSSLVDAVPSSYSSSVHHDNPASEDPDFRPSDSYRAGAFSNLMSITPDRPDPLIVQPGEAFGGADRR
jgi:hypothetical protein